MRGASFYSDLAWLPRAPADFKAQCSAAANAPDGLPRKLQALASYALDPNQLVRLARLIATSRAASADVAPLRPYRLALLSNSTADFLAPALVATGARHGVALECTIAAYGQAMQESLDPESPLYRSSPDGVLLAFDYRGLPLACSPGDAGQTVAAVEASLRHIGAICDGIRANSRATCILQTIAPPAEPLFGSFDRALPGTLRNLVLEVNARLAEMAARPGFALLDAAAIAETVGLAEWHSPQQWNMAKLPFAQDLVPLWADHAARLVAALCGKSRRCLVLDLDNTLWGGVIGDDGLHGIHCAQGDAAGEAFLDFQRYLLALRERGVVLAVSSKNEEAAARLPFRDHPEMVLRERHFAAFQANWNDKPSNIRAIAEALSLGLESFVFVDDNPFERELVRRTLPEVATPEMPEDPALFARTLAASGLFEAAGFSLEDRQRAGYYEANARRAALEVQSGDLGEYLASLRMEIVFQPFDKTGRARIAQLINKSNQFNLTTRRYTEAEIEAMENDPAYFTLQVRLRDAFGDNGMIAVVICKEIACKESSCNDMGAEWEIDAWLMSCRVLGRRVEHMTLREVLAHAARRGVNRLRGVYIPTPRNKLVERHYPDLGFTPLEHRPDGSSVWELAVASAQIAPAPMLVHSLFPSAATPHAA